MIVLIADYTGDFAIVQSNNFTTLFVLSREREVEDSVLDVSILLRDG
jgi:apolipoprotein D and lipocalin family protein